MRLDSRSVSPGEWLRVKYEGSSLRPYHIQIGTAHPIPAFFDREGGIQYLQARCPFMKAAHYNVSVIDGETLEASRVGTVRVAP